MTSIELIVSSHRMLRARFGVDYGRPEPVYAYDELMLRSVGDLVSRDDAHCGVDGDSRVSFQGVAEPPKPDVINVLHTVDRAQDDLALVHLLGVDCIHEPSVDLFGSVLEHHQDCSGDQESNDGIRAWETEGDAACTY